MTNKIDQVTPTEPKNLDELADAGPIAPINLTGETAVKPGNPVDLTEETEVTPGNPVNLTEEGISEPIAPRTTNAESALAPGNPINLTEESISEPIAPRTITGESALAPGNPVNITEEALSKPIAPVTMTRVDAVPPARTGGDVVNLDFCNESYNVDFDYSRASSGTYIDRNKNQFNQYDYLLKNDFVGDVTNLALYSEQLTQSPNGNVAGLVTTLAPEKYKGSNVFKLLDNVDNDSSLAQAVTISNDSLERTFAISIKKSTDATNYAGIRVDTTGGTGIVVTVVFNPFTGVITYQDGTLITSSIVFDEGYWRVSLSYLNNSTGNTTATIRVYPAYNTTGSSTRTNATTGSALVTRLSFTASAKPVPYVKTLAAAVTQAFTASPRIEYDAATGECLGYLAEGPSTNLALYSEQFDNAYWTKGGCSISANNSIAPDGTKSADKLLETTSNTQHSVYKGLTVTPGVFTRSFYVKAAERTFCIIRQFDGETNKGAYFNLQTGVIGTVSAGLTANIESAGNGWFRCSVTYTTAETSERIEIAPAIVDGTSNYVGDTAKGILIWGAQMEAQLFATSYIRTEGSAVTRAADNLEMLSVGYNQSEGTLFVESFLKNINGNVAPFAILSDGTSSNRILNRVNSEGTNQILISTGNVLQSLTEGSIITINQKNKIALTYKSGVARLYLNNIQDILLSYLVLPSSPLSLKVGQRADSSFQLFGYISKVTLYNYALTADEVKAL
jgi:hypothetical protein